MAHSRFRNAVRSLTLLLSLTAAGAAANPIDGTGLKARLEAAGSLDSALAIAEDALEGAIASGSLDSAASVLHVAGETPYIYQDSPEAKERFAFVLLGLDLSPLPEPSRTRFEVDVLGRVGFCGRLDDAQLGLKSILAKRDSLLDEYHRAEAHYMLAFCYYYLGDALTSAGHARQAGEASLRGGDRGSAMESFDGVSTSFYRMGDLDSALYYGRLALMLSRSVEDTARVQNVYLNYSEALGALGTLDSARYYLAMARALLREDDWGMRARLHLAHASLYQIEGHQERRIYELKDAARLFTLNRELHQAVDLRDTIAYAYASLDEYYEAFRYRDRAAAQRDSLYAERVSHDTDARLATLEREQLARDREAAAHREAMAEAVLANAALQRAIFGVALVALCLIIALGILRMRSRRRRNTELERLVEDRTRELTAQAEELRASNAELERFAYIASHDLKTPLRNVTSFVGLAQRRLPPESQEAVGEYLAIAADNARHMHALVSDVLEYSQIGRAEAPPAEELALAALVGEVTRGMRADLDAAGATVTVDGDARAVLPRTSLQQVLTNLIENGLKYNRSEVPVVRVAIVDMGAEVRVAVTDNGIGIAPEYHARVFEVFRRLHTVDEYGGTGVGLSTCEKVVRQLGGTIALESEVGIGSTFTVTLPKRVPVRGGADVRDADAAAVA